MSAYAELHCLSDFSFQRGASSARELFERANDCGYSALAITDECSLAGIVRAYEASLDTHLPLIVGSEFQLEDGPRVVLLVENKAGYIALCRLITRARRASEKGRYRVHRADFANGLPGTLALWLPEREVQPEHGAWLKSHFGERAWLAVELHRDGDDEARLQQLLALGEHLNLRCVASGDVHMHVRRRLPLQQTMTAIRHHLPLSEAGHVLFRNSERHLRRRAELQRLYPSALLEESVRIAERCHFIMSELHYEYPKELVPADYTPMQWLAELVQRGIAWRWPNGVREDIQAKIDKELRLIEKKDYPAYFLTVHDIVREARARDILCQGRGSAANSVVCYTLGVTDADPEKIELVVERFISEERNEPPDIDIDFEHERREEVIQYIYNKYGRERAALAATVICYRAKSAVRDVAKALGLPGEQIDKLSRLLAWWDGEASLDERLREQGFDPAARLIRKIIVLTAQLMDMPSHLSQHVGGFVIADAPLHELVPVENAAMPDRTIIQWDKDDLDRMQLLKIDCLALGMLTCIRKCFQMVKGLGGPQLDMATIPSGDQATYAMIQRADTLGTFQIESRAQMAMLPRLRPACYYDLVIQVAIVRPGPIQGDMVHPYLRRRRGEEKVEYPSEALRPVLQHTLGVPLFQEQVMRLAMVAADYTAGEADQLRRAMAAWRRNGGMEKHRERLLAGMLKNNYSEAFAMQIFEQIKGFGSYGFPESHAASFANIAYASCWLKCHHAAAYACALLNSQPMGFYSPSQIVQDLQRHGIRVQPVDVRHSEWDCSLQKDPRSEGAYALRLGFRQLRGCSEAVGKRIAAARKQQPFADVVDLCARAGLDRRHQDLLADAQALRGLAGHRHRALWLTAGVEAQLPLFGRSSPQEQTVSLPPPTVLENLLADYAHSGLSLDAHPLSLLRKRLRAARYLDSRGLQQLPHETSVRVVGLVTQRQRPQTASGVTFITLEDEFGSINVVVWAQVAQAQRRAFLESRLMAIDGRWETVDGVSHLIARRLHDVSGMLAALDARSRDFH